MTYSNPYSIPSTTTNFIPFSGMGMRKNGRAMLLPSNYQGDGSTLSLDFTTMGGVLDPRLTFTRSTTATYINSSGYVTSAAINAPRFDYSPTNIGEPRGLLVEGNVTNFITQSQALSGYAAYNMMAISIDGTVTDPMGGTETKKIAGTAGTAFHGFLRNGTNAGAATTVTVSIFAKKNNYKYLFLFDGSSATASTRFNLDTGVTDQTLGTGYVSSKMTPYSNGWYRCEMTANVPANINRSWGFQAVADTATYAATGASYLGTGNINDGIYVIGWQVEAGSGASSYIPTGASQVTRNADVCYLTDFAGWSAGGNFNTAEGTLFVDQAVTFVGTSNYPAGGFSTSNTVGSRFGWQYRQGEAPQTYRGLVNAGYLFELPGGSGWSIPAGTTRFRHAMSCGGNTFLRQSFKSSASSGSPTQNNYSDVSTLNISGVAAFTLTQSALASSVRIARVKYYPRAFTLAELDALTN